MKDLDLAVRVTVAIASLPIAVAVLTNYDAGKWFWALSWSDWDGLAWAVPLAVAALTVLLGRWRPVFDSITVVVTAIPVGAVLTKTMLLAFWAAMENSLAGQPSPFGMLVAIGVAAMLHAFLLRDLQALALVWGVLLSCSAFTAFQYTIFFNRTGF